MSEAPLDSVPALLASQRALRDRFDALHRDFLRGGERKPASAMHDFEVALQLRIELECSVLLPVLERVQIPGRDARRELELQHAQLRELLRHLRERVASREERGIVLGLFENLARRLAAHAAELEHVYYPAAIAHLDASQRRSLAGET